MALRDVTDLMNKKVLLKTGGLGKNTFTPLLIE
jgi:hypothetical protein